MNTVIISGSPRKQSITIRVARFLKTYLTQLHPEHTYDIISLADINLPFVDKVWSDLNQVPEEHKAMAEKIFNADAFILVSPEYNGGYSPAMKNLLDHFPKQGRKVFGIVTASPGALGGIRAAQQMQNLVIALFGITSPYMLIVPAVDKKFNDAGELMDDSFTNAIRTFTTEFMWLACTTCHARKHLNVLN